MSSLFGEIELPAALTLSYGVGRAAGSLFEAQLEPLRQSSWQLLATQEGSSVRPDPVLLAAGVAQGQIKYATAQEWASYSGVSKTVFDALIEIANTGPALGSALTLLRRGTWSEAAYRTALNRMAIESQWHDGLVSLQHDRLDLGAISTAVHRGIMKDEGLLVTTVPTGSGNVPRIPVSTLDTLAEFKAQGIDPERARVLVADTGLPLALGEMLQLLNRNKVTKTDVKVSIAESNVRNEYMDVALDLARRLLTPHEYAEAQLRGVKSPDDAKSGASLSGLNGDDYDTLFAILGRPLNIHQVTTGLARGGTYGGDYSDVPEGPYRDAIRRSAVRPEYASLDYANRYSYPSGFQIKSEAQAGDLTEAQTEEILLEIGWSPKWAKFFATKWTAAAAKADKTVTSAQTSLKTATKKAYLTGKIDAAKATAALTTADVSSDATTHVLALWDAEKALTAA